MAASDFFRRTLFSTREKPTSSDWNKVMYRAMETCRMIAADIYGEAYTSTSSLSPGLRFDTLAPQGFHGAAFYVTPDAGNAPYGVSIAPGFGIARTAPATATSIDSDTGADWDNSVAYGAPLVLSAAQGFTVPAVPAPGNSRIDIIEVKASYLATDAATVGIFNLGSRAYDATSRNKALSWDLRTLTGSVNAPNPSTQPISYVVGQNFAGGIAGATEPTVTSGYVRIARINLDGAVAAITQDLIADLRPILLPQGVLRVAGQLEFPGTAAGLATHNIRQLEVPAGVVCQAYFTNSVAPTAGGSYTVTVVLVGGNFTSRRGNSAGVVVASPATSTSTHASRIATVGTPITSVINATTRSYLGGLTGTITAFDINTDWALGQPIEAFSLKVWDPAGVGVSATEYVNFSYTKSLG